MVVDQGHDARGHQVQLLHVCQVEALQVQARRPDARECPDLLANLVDGAGDPGGNEVSDAAAESARPGA